METDQKPPTKTTPTNACDLSIFLEHVTGAYNNLNRRVTRLPPLAYHAQCKYAPLDI